MKIARGYWQARGEHQRVHVVSRETGYHGTHGYGTSITGIPPNREGWGVLAGENTVAPLHDLDGVEDNGCEYRCTASGTSESDASIPSNA